MTLLFRLLLILAATTFAIPAWSWDPHGHALVGSVADQLLSENARRQVRDILGFTLQSAAKWPDCVRSVERKPDGSFQYNRNTPYQAPCDDFMAPAEVARMEDYARRNWDNCAHGPGHGCHEAYHFTDVPIQLGAYSRSFFGTNDHDVASALAAAIEVLEGKKPPPPSRSGTRRRLCSWSPTLPATSISRCMSVRSTWMPTDPSSTRPLPCPASSRRKRRAAT